MKANKDVSSLVSQVVQGSDNCFNSNIVDLLHVPFHTGLCVGDIKLGQWGRRGCWVGVVLSLAESVSVQRRQRAPPKKSQLKV